MKLPIPWMVFVLLLYIPGVAVLAQEPSSKRPRIAVVLAGGGAKGAAHIGVLKALEELRVPIDEITGTSMGAYMGGLYATGISADQLKRVVDGVDWNNGYRDRVVRSDRRIRDKELEDRYQINTDIGIGWVDIRVPKGVVQGQNMLRILRETVGDVPKLTSFDDLAIPYRAVATDIVALKPFVLDQGYLVDAMMASMSVPGVLPPYKVGDRLLVDGGVTDNMPVDVARDQMGADVVIAVDISTDYKREKDFTDFLTVADQLSNYLVRQSTQRQANILSAQDIYLKPDVGQMDTTEFDRMNEAYLKGYQITMAHRAELEKLALSPMAYQHYLSHKMSRAKALKKSRLWTFDRIELENQTHYRDDVLKALLKIVPQQAMTQAFIETRIDNLYAYDRFELIQYRVEYLGEQTVLVVSVREKSWGPNYVNFHFALEDDFNTQSQYSIGISSNFTALDDMGSELRLDLEMGNDRKIFVELYSPIMESQKLFSTFSINYEKEERSVPQAGFENVSLKGTTDYFPVTYLTLEGEMSLGYQYRLWDEFSVGVRVSDGKSSLSTFASEGDIDFNRTGVFWRYRLDTLDDSELPTHGFFLNLDYLWSHDRMTSQAGSLANSYNDMVYEYSVKAIDAYSFGRHTLVGHIEYGEVGSKKSITPIDPKTIGGLLNLSGIPKNSLMGQNKAFSSLVYRYRWFDNDFGLFTAPVYVGASIEYGGVWSDSSLDFKDVPLYTAGAIFTGVDSPIGPVMLGYGRTEHNYDSIYLMIGHVL